MSTTAFLAKVTWMALPLSRVLEAYQHQEAMDGER